MKYVIVIAFIAAIFFGMQYVVAQGNDKAGLTDWGIAKDNPLKNFK
jgi:hypothetical protein